ncbi:MAG: type II toxin-antitoxin system VapC family toxin [Actinobacteria bacterium]|nr:type II toxin-antitoxin system VapC family toxin [Actinomycetota bacterium]
MIVLDTSVMIPLLVDLPEATVTVLTALGGRFDENRGAPHLIDVETTHALRRLSALGRISEAAASMAVEDLQSMRLERYPHHVLLPRIWELRPLLTAYDAAYLALAEILEAPLVTRDRAFLTIDTDAEVVLAV